MNGTEPNLIGAYGTWCAELIGRKAGSHSLRSGDFSDVEEWRTQARQRVWDRLAPPELPSLPEVRVEESGSYNGLSYERLSWQLPYGPRTEAVFLKPEGVMSPLPGILALHDHGGQKYFGWRKIARIDERLHPKIGRAHV